MNRQQKRAAMRRGKAPGQTYADVLATKRMVAAAVERQVHSESVRLEADIINQRLLWESVVALNEAFGFGGQRAIRFMEALEKVCNEVIDLKENYDEAYAFEKLRQRASAITGIDVKYVHEDEMIAAKKYAEADGFHFPPDSDL